jgi:DNA modification methylase
MTGRMTVPGAIHSTEPVGGYTHDFYRYPARFSPQFARAMILHFTAPKEIVVDPFMGGGTTLVEATLLGRPAIGTDISSLAVFIAKVKTTPLVAADFDRIRKWADGLGKRLNLRNPCKRKPREQNADHQHNISGRATWPVRKIIELALEEMERLSDARQRRFARCALLRTAQWALDCRKDTPAADQVRTQLLAHLELMIAGGKDFANAIKCSAVRFRMDDLSAHCLHRSAIGIQDVSEVKTVSPPALILTSPPYPGVHVLYHRWQVLGRKETSAAFWIAGSQDGHGASFYTFGDRKQQGLTRYYEKIGEAFRSISAICSHKTMIVQMLSFSEPLWQLPQYLEVLDRAGLIEQKFPGWSNSLDGRIWRDVPNRKWYANRKGPTHSSKEVVLFHKLR